MKTKLGILALILVAFSGCYYDIEEELYPTGCNTPDVISYSNDVAPIMAGWCAISGCHVTGGTGIGLLDNYDGLKQKIDEGIFQQRVFEDLDMPPNATFPPCHAELIMKWIDQGAPNN